MSKFIQSLCLYLSDILYSYKSLFHEYLMFNITKETTICNYGHVREIFSQLNIYASYLASLNFEFNDLTKFETSFMLNLENSQVMFFFLLVPVSSFLDFGDRWLGIWWDPESWCPGFQKCLGFTSFISTERFSWNDKRFFHILLRKLLFLEFSDVCKLK